VRLLTTRVAVAVACAAALLAAGSASAELQPSQTRLYLSAEGCGATQEGGTLSTSINPAAGSDGCGVIGGLPLDEVLHQLEANTPMDFVTGKEDGVPAVLDTAEDVTGVFALQSWTGGVGAVGQVTVDLVLTGTYLDDKGKSKFLELGSGSFSVLGSPASVVTSVPFSFELPTTAAGKTFTSITLSAANHGANVNGSAQSYNGTSYLDLPVLVEEEAAQP